MFHSNPETVKSFKKLISTHYDIAIALIATEVSP